MTMAETYCKACDMINREVSENLHDVILLGEHWSVNQYMGGERFPGWLVMQPRRHCMRIQDLTVGELLEFWVQFVRVEEALKTVWPEVFPGDKVERVYITLFFENTEGFWHLHFHIVPRTDKMRNEIPTFHENHVGITEHTGWYIVRQTTYDEYVLGFKDCVAKLMVLLDEVLSDDG